MILVLAQKRREGSLWLLRIAMMTIESWFVFNSMENIDGTWLTVLMYIIGHRAAPSIIWYYRFKQTQLLLLIFFHCLGHSYGNYFDPAKDCSSIVDNVPKTRSGVYWFKTEQGPIKVIKYCAIFNRANSTCVQTSAQ
jgi:hypothetical protein